MNTIPFDYYRLTPVILLVTNICIISIYVYIFRKLRLEKNSNSHSNQRRRNNRKTAVDASRRYSKTQKVLLERNISASDIDLQNNQSESLTENENPDCLKNLHNLKTGENGVVKVGQLITDTPIGKIKTTWTSTECIIDPSCRISDIHPSTDLFTRKNQGMQYKNQKNVSAMSRTKSNLHRSDFLQRISIAQLKEEPEDYLGLGLTPTTRYRDKRLKNKSNCHNGSVISISKSAQVLGVDLDLSFGPEVECSRNIVPGSQMRLNRQGISCAVENLRQNSNVSFISGSSMFSDELPRKKLTTDVERLSTVFSEPDADSTDSESTFADFSSPGRQITRPVCEGPDNRQRLPEIRKKSSEKSFDERPQLISKKSSDSILSHYSNRSQSLIPGMLSDKSRSELAKKYDQRRKFSVHHENNNNKNNNHRAIIDEWKKQLTYNKASIPILAPKNSISNYQVYVVKDVKGKESTLEGIEEDDEILRSVTSDSVSTYTSSKSSTFTSDALT